MAILLFCLLQIRCVSYDAICVRWLQENFDRQSFLQALCKKERELMILSPNKSIAVALWQCVSGGKINLVPFFPC